MAIKNLKERIESILGLEVTVETYPWQTGPKSPVETLVKITVDHQGDGIPLSRLQELTEILWQGNISQDDTPNIFIISGVKRE